MENCGDENDKYLYVFLSLHLVAVANPHKNIIVDSFLVYQPLFSPTLKHE